jgi:hypothetical protein
MALVLFVSLELWRHDLLAELRLYRNAGFAIVSMVILINAVNFWASHFMQTILRQRPLGYTSAQAGFATLPGAFSHGLLDIGGGAISRSVSLVQWQLTRESTVTAYQDCFLLMTAWCIIVMPLVYFIRRAPRQGL